MTRLWIGTLLLCCCAEAQNPRIGVIEIFGARKVPVAKIRKALGVIEGQPIPPSRAELQDRLEAIDGIVASAVTAVCCEDGQAILYLGVEERGAPHFDFHTPPSLELRVPDEVEQEWLEFIAAVNLAARNGNTDEDLTSGHSLMTDPIARRSQERFVGLADTHIALLREVLRKSADDQQRGIAAFVLGYASQKKAVADDLLYAMQDSDETVRNNAMRALSAIYVLSQKKPELGLKISPTWFVEMLNSVHFTDRSKAAAALVSFTESRDPSLIEHLRQRVMPSILEMARWQNLSHALPAFILAGRIAGLPEEKIQDIWRRGARDEVLKRFRK